MLKFVQYLGLVMAIIYILFGGYLMFGTYLFGKGLTIPNANIFGGLLIGYGVFRIIRFTSRFKKVEDKPTV